MFTGGSGTASRAILLVPMKSRGTQRVCSRPWVFASCYFVWAQAGFRVEEVSFCGVLGGVLFALCHFLTLSLSHSVLTAHNTVFSLCFNVTERKKEKESDREREKERLRELHTHTQKHYVCRHLAREDWCSSIRGYCSCIDACIFFLHSDFWLLRV